MRQLKSKSSIMIPIRVQGITVDGIIDTASDVTIISDKVYNSLPVKPSIVKSIALHTAGRDMSMKGYLLEPMTIDIKGLQFNESLYVAPIEDAMLIGLDFLSKYHVEIDMKQGLFGIQGQKIPFIEGKGNSVHDVHVTEVRMVRRTVIPARSALRIHCNTDHPLKPACYLVEPDVKTVLAPRVCIVGAGEPVMSFVNLSDCNNTF